MDPGMLAVAAIYAALPYVECLGREVAKSAAAAGGKWAWEWIKGRLTTPIGREALDALEKSPDDAANRKIVEGVLTKLLQSDPAALAELAHLLDKTGTTSAAQKTAVRGDGNIVTQTAGSGTVTINASPARVGKRKSPLT